MKEQPPSQYWKSWEQRPGASELVQISTREFPEPLSGPATQVSRRSFLKAAGFTTAIAMAGAGCSRMPVEKAIPYLVQPEEIVPGLSYFYASACQGCASGCGVLVKSRDGRPIKLEGNPDHPLSKGGLCAVGQASLLELYDSHRLDGPLLQGQKTSWDELDQQIQKELAAIRASAGKVRFLSSTITSPTLLAEIQRFLSEFPGARHVTYDALSSSAILSAHEKTHGERLLPHYRLDRAEVIVSFDADFLGTWVSPVEFTRAYAAGRRVNSEPPRMSFHAQIESRMSLTGTKADQRTCVSVEELPRLIEHLAVRLAQLAGTTAPGSANVTLESHLSEVVENLAHRLWSAQGKSVVLCGLQDSNTQTVINFINHVLGNYGSTLDLDRPSLQRSGNNHELQELIQEMREGTVAALFVYAANPVCELPDRAEIAELVRRIPLTVSFAARMDETASSTRFVCPDHHALESWGDAEPIRGMLTLQQPAIRPLRNTRAALESISSWRGQPQSSYDALQEHWRERIFPRQAEKEFQVFWDRSVEAGFAEISITSDGRSNFRQPALSVSHTPLEPGSTSWSLQLYSKVAMLDGRHAHNPWLQELPDPVTKVSWDNYACLSPAAADRLGVRQGDVVRIEVPAGGGQPAAVELPVYAQPGQHDQLVAVALGYGREGTERFADVGPKWWFGRSGVGPDGRVGRNVAQLLSIVDGEMRYSRSGIRLAKTDKTHALACTQDHHNLTMPHEVPLVGGTHREIVNEISFAELLTGQKTAETHAASSNGLWPNDHPYDGHRWAMAIDLNACTGCSACVVACQAENNIPVVGKDEVQRHREMHWIRIDRYYTGDVNVDVVHQPMLCQQCDNAPCETVCPVLATVHSAEGLNQQIYNRCIGTRYCANNCPYKTRRFNWFNYSRNDHLQNLALNPDVTVRSRGIMEKCTFCVQRIEAAHIDSRRTGAAIADGQIQTACQQSCPAQAIVFGDINDPGSRVSQMARDPRRFAVLEEFNFRPAINYLAVVRNRETQVKEHHNG